MKPPEEFAGFFRALDKKLSSQEAIGKMVLYLFGGAAAVMAYGAKRGTLDIDATSDENDRLRQLLAWGGRGSELEKLYGYYLHAANTELMLIEAPDWKTRSVEIMKGKFRHIRIMALSREDLILSKLSRYNDRDRQDIQHLLAAGKTSRKKLIKLYLSARKYYAGNLRTLDQTFSIVLKEHYDLPFELPKE
jgi:hypothetical protein